MRETTNENISLSRYRRVDLISTGNDFLFLLRFKLVRMHNEETNLKVADKSIDCDRERIGLLLFIILSLV